MELINYLLELEKFNLKLQKQLAKLQVKNVSYQHEVSALKKFQPKSNILQLIRPFRQEKVNKQEKEVLP